MPPTIAQIERMSPPFYDQEGEAVQYPDSDGKPMADNTRQFRYIATLKGGFDSYYKDRDDVFVAGDLLWYPVEGDNKTRYAPDVMIAFGRPPGDRGSYQQWRENGQAPDVVFEVLSPGNSVAEMQKKLEAYDKFQVKEYYEYDPDDGKLRGWIRSGDGSHLEQIPDMIGWKSPLTEVTFSLDDLHLVVTRPDGYVFLDYVEADDMIDSERARADAAEQQVEQAQAQNEKLAAKLREMGIDPEAI